MVCYTTVGDFALSERSREAKDKSRDEDPEVVPES